ncbi:Uncharacterized metalloprotease yggG [Serratia fonticola]|uniref:Uncharacterized metalloprotease yggG n=1 Tax=Serratia fonticola TaxID=47917 RepID=A0A4U9UCP0_SERFO|nr:Uncharacterized metalloprotease yggG [Serratia fonticola]
MANGCIRVYSGLMDMMDDNEVEGVLGHEMGHVALATLVKPCRSLMGPWHYVPQHLQLAA